MSPNGKVRVMHVLEATAGGTRQHLVDMVEQLSSDVELHVVVALRRDLRFAEDIEQFRRRGVAVSIVSMRRTPDPLHDLQTVMELRTVLQRHPCDVLHLHSARAGWFGRLAARHLPCHVIYAPHALPFLQSGVIGGTSWVAEKLIARFTDSLLAVSHDEATLAVRHGLVDWSQVDVIPNAIDVKAFDRLLQPARPRRAGSRTRTVGFIAELRAQKAPTLFVEAAREVLRRGIPARFVVPSSGALLRDVRALVARWGLTPAFEFISGEGRLREVLLRSDVVVLPSLWEGFPYALLEALASLKPVIASNLPVFQRVLGPLDQRLLVDAGDARSLADGMCLWLEQPEATLTDVARNGRRLVERDYSMADWKRRVLDVYAARAAQSSETIQCSRGRYGGRSRRASVETRSGHWPVQP